MRVLIFLCLILAACGRPLTPAEQSFATQIHGDTIDTSRIRAIHGAPVGVVTYQRPKRPRLACRELILPEPETELVTVSPAAVALHNKVFFARDWYLENYMRDYPQQMDLLAAMLFAHEMTHVWQWQNRNWTGYTPWHAIGESIREPDPYFSATGQSPDFLGFGYEQQAATVEDYVCFAFANPTHPRRAELRALLEPVFPVDAFDAAIDRQGLIPNE